jgi:hypothetical protein
MEKIDFINMNSNFGIPFGRLSDLKTKVSRKRTILKPEEQEQ